MKKLMTFFKQLQLRQLLTVALAAVVLLVGTACNQGTETGARPDNPPVQMGGANNPYKSGGDTNNNFKLSPDPKVSQQAGDLKRNRADLPFALNQLIAAGDAVQYPGAQNPENRAAVEKSLPKIGLEDFEKAEEGGLIQRQSDYGDRVGDRLSTVKESLDEASEFIGEGAKEALESYESTPNANR